MSLVTRQYGPDAKGSKLTNLDMDNNLYYLQSIGVSGLTFSANTLTLTNPTGGTIANALIDVNADSRWYIPSGSTVEIGSYSQSFVYGDLYVLGTLLLNENSQLIILNGDLILSGGTISGSGQTVLVDLPTFGDLINTTGLTYNNLTNTITLTDNTNNSLNAYIDGFSGLSVNGTLSATTLQASNAYIDSTGYLYFGDSSTDGSWRMSISGANFIVEKRVGGNWIISGTFN